MHCVMGTSGLLQYVNVTLWELGLASRRCSETDGLRITPNESTTIVKLPRVKRDITSVQRIDVKSITLQIKKNIKNIHKKH